MAGSYKCVANVACVLMWPVADLFTDDWYICCCSLHSLFVLHSDCCYYGDSDLLFVPGVTYIGDQ